MSINIGDHVIFKKGLYKDEEGAIYCVLEINGDRTVLELINTNMAIRPQSIALLSELDSIKDTYLPADHHTFCS